eukprot:6189687-Pleurochrysis_carterae.AAC.2
MRTAKRKGARAQHWHRKLSKRWRTTHGEGGHYAWMHAPCSQQDYPPNGSPMRLQKGANKAASEGQCARPARRGANQDGRETAANRKSSAWGCDTETRQRPVSPITKQHGHGHPASSASGAWQGGVPKGAGRKVMNQDQAWWRGRANRKQKASQ